MPNSFRLGLLTYEILDYIEVTEITSRGFLTKQMVKTSDGSIRNQKRLG